MTQEQEEVLLKSLPLLKEFITRPKILEYLGKDGLAVAKDEVTKFEKEIGFRIEERKLREKSESIKAETQQNCCHIAGDSPLSDCRDYYGRTSIVWHVLNPQTSYTIGICSLCFRTFRPEDEDYMEWRKRSSMNRISSAGVEVPMEEDELIPENQFMPVETTFYNRKNPTTRKQLLQTKDFETLSDFEIKELMEYLREERKTAKETQNVAA